MSQQSFGTLPNKPTIPINPFKVEIAQEKIDNLNQLLKATEPPTKTYENLTTGKDGNEDLGVSHEWLSNALKVWKDDFSWWVVFLLNQFVEIGALGSWIAS